MRFWRTSCWDVDRNSKVIGIRRGPIRVCSITIKLQYIVIDPCLIGMSSSPRVDFSRHRVQLPWSMDVGNDCCYKTMMSIGRHVSNSQWTVIFIAVHTRTHRQTDWLLLSQTDWQTDCYCHRQTDRQTAVVWMMFVLRCFDIRLVKYSINSYFVICRLLDKVGRSQCYRFSFLPLIQLSLPSLQGR